MKCLSSIQINICFKNEIKKIIHIDLEWNFFLDFEFRINISDKFISSKHKK